MKHLILSILIAMLAVLPAQAQIPQTMSYQGVLTDGGGTPVLDGSYSLTFKIYTASSGGSDIWTETQTVQVTGGIFSAILGSLNPLDVSFDAPYWLGVAVDGGAEFAPRRTLTAAAYSLNSQGVVDSAITAPKIASGQVVKSLNALTDAVTLAAGANVAIATSNDSLIISASGGGGSLDWSLTGNAGTSPGTNFLGTTDDRPLEIHVNSVRAMRFEPDAAGLSPNIIGGSWLNRSFDGAIGATIGGGGGQANTFNYVSDDYGTVGGGSINRAGSYNGVPDDAIYATVGGGYHNDATATESTVGGGGFNEATDVRATVGGGFQNLATMRDATIGGGVGNAAGGRGATVGGGTGNVASGNESVVAGGVSNQAIRNQATVGGGASNSAASVYTTVSGGRFNTASGLYDVVAGGQNNSAEGQWAFVGGGDSDTAAGMYSTVAGGRGNRAGQNFATVGGGWNNTASGAAATVVGGSGNSAASAYSVASGLRATIDAAHGGVFMFADNSNFDFNSAASNEFAARATGGVRFVTAIDGAGTPTAGVTVASGGGSWSTLSDRNAKENFTPIDCVAVLEQIDAIDVSAWNYKTQDASIRHMGPTAQDFYAAFGLGEGDTRINTVDADGVALAAIKGLHRIVKEKDVQIAELERRMAELEAIVRLLSQKSGVSALAAGEIETAEARVGDK